METTKHWLLLVALILPSLGAGAQQAPRLSIVIERVDEAGTRCGLTESAIESTVALTLRNNGVQVEPGASNPYIAAMVNLVHTSFGCLGAVRVRVTGMSNCDRTIGRFKSRQPAFTVLCERGAVVTSETENAGSHLLQVVERMVKLCLGDLEY